MEPFEGRLLGSSAEVPPPVSGSKSFSVGEKLSNFGLYGVSLLTEPATRFRVVPVAPKSLRLTADRARV